MAELVYDETGRLLFTEEMAKEYTLLVPQMLPVTFRMLVKLVELDGGYHIEILETNTQKVVETGLKYVHNDMCYPAILSIGQLIEAVESGRYDKHKVALMITQTGGGCRDCTGTGHVAVVAFKSHTDFADGTVAVVSQAVNDNGNTACGVTFVNDFFKDHIAEFTDTFFDSAVNVGIGHIDSFCCGQCGAERGVG